MVTRGSMQIFCQNETIFSDRAHMHRNDYFFLW
uniref:Uncharacterized protein n=1 Tax=Arundo donax TaxID=35708 RepID=A0A0A9DUA7_ARUDO